MRGDAHCMFIDTNERAMMSLFKNVSVTSILTANLLLLCVQKTQFEFIS